MKNEQIGIILEKEGLSASQFAAHIGVQRALVSQLQSNRHHVSLDIVKRIHAAFPNISTEWLLTGEGNYSIGDDSLSAVQTVQPSLLSSDTLAGDQKTAPTLFGESMFETAEPVLQSPLAMQTFDASTANETMQQQEVPIRKSPQESTSHKAVHVSDDEQPVLYMKKQERNIAEIKIFYDDGTYETYCRVER